MSEHLSTTPSIFNEALIVEKILSFTNVCEWIKNRPPLINQTFCNVFNSEHFAKSFLVQVLKLNDEQVRLLEDGVANFKPVVENAESEVRSPVSSSELISDSIANENVDNQADEENEEDAVVLNNDMSDEEEKGDDEENEESQEGNAYHPRKIGSSNPIPNYSSMQVVFKEYVSCSLMPKVNLANLVSQYSSECDNNIADPILGRIEEESKALRLSSNIYEKVFTEYYDCDLIISENGNEYEIKNVSRFWKGGPLKQLFIKSIKPIRENFGHQEGGFDIDTVIFMGFGYPLNISFRGDYSKFEGDAAYFEEAVSSGKNDIFCCQEGYCESTSETTYLIMNNFLSVKQDEIPKELEVERVYNTILYHWCGPFLHGKSRMGEEFREIMKEYNFDEPVIYTDSFMKKNQEYAKKRKANESTTKSKKIKLY